MGKPLRGAALRCSTACPTSLEDDAIRRELGYCSAIPTSRELGARYPYLARTLGGWVSYSYIREKSHL